MAVRRTRSPRKRQSGKAGRTSFSMIFWVFFIVFLITIFFALLPRVKKNLSPRQTFVEQVEEQPTPDETPPTTRPPERTTPDAKPAEPPAAPARNTQERDTSTRNTQERDAPPKPAEPPSSPPTQPRPQQPTTQPTPPAPATPPQPAPQPTPPATPPAEQPAETRDRSIYFMQERPGADLLLVKVNRKLPVSNSPLIDSINALLAGPTAEERRRELNTFIPQNTRLLSARVNGNTVFLNFNEAFRYNTFGREGCEAQLKQIVWTATEFSNVDNVQIQIDGKIVDFLIEGIMIRNPIGR
ncbi:MAG: GerMN domain-containing protein [Treponema sp.]|nr:GerMN domain-containing protein [Treponema sp.]